MDSIQWRSSLLFWTDELLIYLTRVINANVTFSIFLDMCGICSFNGNPICFNYFWALRALRL